MKISNYLKHLIHLYDISSKIDTWDDFYEELEQFSSHFWKNSAIFWIILSILSNLLTIFWGNCNISFLKKWLSWYSKQFDVILHNFIFILSKFEKNSINFSCILNFLIKFSNSFIIYTILSKLYHVFITFINFTKIHHLFLLKCQEMLQFLNIR